MNINEINVVEDWDQPVEEGTTGDLEEIKGQAAKYYSWLYAPKETPPFCATPRNSTGWT